MQRSYNEVKICTGTSGGHYINIPKETIKAAEWNLTQEKYNIFKINDLTLVISQQDIPSLVKIGDHKIDRCNNAYGPNNTVRVSVGRCLRFNTKLAVRTYGKDDRIYIQVI